MIRRPGKAVAGMTLVELLIVCFIVGVLAGMLIPNLQIGVIKTRAVACKTNLRNIATAIQVYYTDADGFYPKQLSPVFPTYMQQIPTCPSASIDTYTDGYEASENQKAFTLHCRGSYHADYNYQPDEPYYSSSEGLQPSSH